MLIAPDSQRLMLLPCAFQCLAVLSSGIRCKCIRLQQLALCPLQHGVFLLLQLLQMLLRGLRTLLAFLPAQIQRAQLFCRFAAGQLIAQALCCLPAGMRLLFSPLRLLPGLLRLRLLLSPLLPLTKLFCAFVHSRLLCRQRLQLLLHLAALFIIQQLHAIGSGLQLLQFLLCLPCQFVGALRNLTVNIGAG